MMTRHQGFGAYDVPFLEKKKYDGDSKDDEEVSALSQRSTASQSPLPRMAVLLVCLPAVFGVSF